MDSFTLNKIMGAVLGTLLFVMGAGFLAEAIYHPIEGRGAGYALPEPEAGNVAEGPATAEPTVSLGALLANASAEAGQAAVRKCQSCHNFGAGEPNKTGPGLYDVVDRLIGSHEGFAYSAGMEEHKAAGDTWTYANLDHFIESPKTFTPGTKMNFGGVKSPEERADILAYLQTLSASPKPFPAPEAAAPAAGEAAPAAGDAAPAAAGETAVPTDGNAVATPTTTATETPVAGTPTTSGAGAAPAAPAEPAPAAPAEPAPAAPAPAAPAAPAPAAPSGN